MTIKTHKCKVSRRGKAARGFVEVETIGIPVVPETPTADGTTKEWSYDHLTDVTVNDLVAFCKAKSLPASVIFAQGIDDSLKSSNMRENNAESLTVAHFVSKLGCDKEYALVQTKEYNRHVKATAEVNANLRPGQAAYMPFSLDEWTARCKRTLKAAVKAAAPKVKTAKVKAVKLESVASPEPVTV